MPKCVVSGYIGFDNFGDEAIASVLVSKLRAEGAEEITLISSNPQKTKDLHGVNSCGMFNFFGAIKNADILISGGGSLLQDVTSVKSLIYYLAVIYTALLLGKKVEIFAQGIGPINSILGNILTKYALKRCSKISVRDKKSQELLKKWNIESTLVNDPVLDIDLPVKNKKGTLGIQLREFAGVNKTFLNRLADFVQSKFKDKNIEILSLQDRVDLEICRQFAVILQERGLTNITILSNLSVKDVFEKISDLEYLVAMRFHANVVGIKSGVKTIAINYDPKVQKLAEEYSIPLIELNQENITADF